MVIAYNSTVVSYLLIMIKYYTILLLLLATTTTYYTATYYYYYILYILLLLLLLHNTINHILVNAKWLGTYYELLEYILHYVPYVPLATFTFNSRPTFSN